MGIENIGIFGLGISRDKLINQFKNFLLGGFLVFDDIEDLNRGISWSFIEDDDRFENTNWFVLPLYEQSLILSYNLSLGIDFGLLWSMIKNIGSFLDNRLFLIRLVLGCILESRSFNIGLKDWFFIALAGSIDSAAFLTLRDVTLLVEIILLVKVWWAKVPLFGVKQQLVLHLSGEHGGLILGFLSGLEHCFLDFPEQSSDHLVGVFIRIILPDLLDGFGGDFTWAILLAGQEFFVLALLGSLSLFVSH